MSNEIEKNINNIKNKISFATQKYNRNPNEIELIVVSKFQSAEKVQSAYQAGVRHFGENYIQEWKEKISTLSHYFPEIKWHIIGNVQSNKTKYINSHIHCLQSMDKISLAKEIEKKAPLDSKLNVLVQLQIDKNDINKSGVTFEEAKQLCEFIAKSNKMQLQGFMGIGPLEIKDNQRRELYSHFVQESHKLWKEFSLNLNKTPVISLGMSSDFEIALECGSTMLRIGTAIFGERKKDVR
ncbi:YggS family pyridoxal phosphate-dependent enzyme [Silvanigrella aquatica]|uniref:Pyridoxal phosphate homeostasis protein n=1 Tax=Silvanigrella aquatica TaxID=1915309 RepID=A0A1L4D0Y2_9BACT|nr:YggS family pyridoxal phosphate-dependent enzyme [Silvanigrella aquatica]APJ03865.1 YggS family pyridoxal phosphate enzyme [Silvanigrella aquatica]